MKKLWWLGALAAAVAPPALAQAQGSPLVSFGVGAGERLISVTTLPASTSGQLVVSFHGDPATGCAQRGLCGYSGTIVLRPGDTTLGVVKTRDRRRVTYQVSFVPGFGNQATQTFAHVQRANAEGTAGLCADAAQPNALPSATSHGGPVRLALIARDSSVLTTRCAGPLDGDVASTVPSVVVPVTRLVRGHLALGLSGTRAFAANGFAGTVSSTVVIHVGAPRHQTGLRSTSANRIRTVTETLSVVRESGQFVARVRGSHDPAVCQALDSCGLSGTITIDPKFARATAMLTASARTTRPYRDLLAALGLTHQGNPRGVQVYGSIESAQSSVTTHLTQVGPCVDSVPVADSYIVLLAQGSAFGATYLAPSSLKARCPGPIPNLYQLAFAHLRHGVLDRPEITLALHSAQPLTDDGYVGAVRGRINLVLRRGRVSQHVS